MIRNQWYVLLESNEVKDKPIGVTRMGEKMAFWRDSIGKVYCAVDKCPHRGIQPSSLKSGEALIQSDLPIIEYRRKRQTLQEKAEPA